MSNEINLTFLNFYPSYGKDYALHQGLHEMIRIKFILLYWYFHLFLFLSALLEVTAQETDTYQRLIQFNSGRAGICEGQCRLSCCIFPRTQTEHSQLWPRDSLWSTAQFHKYEAEECSKSHSKINAHCRSTHCHKTNEIEKAYREQDKSTQGYFFGAVGSEDYKRAGCCSELMKHICRAE